MNYPEFNGSRTDIDRIA